MSYQIKVKSFFNLSLHPHHAKPQNINPPDDSHFHLACAADCTGHLWTGRRIAIQRVSENSVRGPLGTQCATWQDCIFNDVVSGDLTIAIPPSIGVQLISKKIPQFMRENPLLKLNICYQNKIPELLKDNIDIAITPHFPIKSLNQKVKKIGSYPIKLFCTKQYQQKYGVPNTPDELVDHQVVGIMTDYLVVSKIRTFEHAISKETYEVEMPNFITSNNTVNNIELIKSNEVIAWTWSFSDLLDHENGFVEVLADYKQEPLSFYLLKHPYRDDKNLTVFAEFIEKIFQESRELGDTNII